MPGEAVFEWVEVEVAAAACVVGGVQAEAEVYACYEYSDVVSDADAGVQCYLFGEGVDVELASGAFFVFFEQPDVSGVDEECTVEV